MMDRFTKVGLNTIEELKKEIIKENHKRVYELSEGLGLKTRSDIKYILEFNKKDYE